MNKKLLIAPLNWGLGHAARCIPIIEALLEHYYTPVIASDGAALALLRKEYPDLEYVILPSYNITYAKQGKRLKWKLLFSAPKIVRAIYLEHQALKRILITHKIDGIISDNRFGLHHKGLPSVFITHQLRVLSGSTTWLSTALHQRIIKKFDICWVPDYSDKPNLSGRMGHVDQLGLNVKHIGPLSRFQKLTMPYEYEVMILLSGPEPQRGILERQLLSTFKAYQGEVLFVRGVIEKEQTCDISKHMTLYNYMTSSQLEKALNASKLVVARSGYTTIMDLEKLEKKAFFIPTPGQPEQEYLATLMLENNWAPSCKQEDFSLEKLGDLEDYDGFKPKDQKTTFKELLRFFEGK